MSKDQSKTRDKEELISAIKECFERHQDKNQWRAVVSKELNDAGIKTVTGKDWNPDRLRQFVRTNIPELLEVGQSDNRVFREGEIIEVEPSEATEETAQAGSGETAESPEDEGDVRELVKSEIASVVEDLRNADESLAEHLKTRIQEQIDRTKDEIEAGISDRIKGADRTAEELRDEALPKVREDLEAKIDSLGDELRIAFAEQIRASELATHGALEGVIPRVRSDIDARVEKLRKEIEEQIRVNVDRIEEVAVEATASELPQIRDEMEARIDELRTDIIRKLEEETRAVKRASDEALETALAEAKNESALESEKRVEKLTRQMDAVTGNSEELVRKKLGETLPEVESKLDGRIDGAKADLEHKIEQGIQSAQSSALTAIDERLLAMRSDLEEKISELEERLTGRMTEKIEALGKENEEALRKAVSELHAGVDRRFDEIRNDIGAIVLNKLEAMIHASKTTAGSTGTDEGTPASKEADVRNLIREEVRKTWESQAGEPVKPFGRWLKDSVITWIRDMFR